MQLAGRVFAQVVAQQRFSVGGAERFAALPAVLHRQDQVVQGFAAAAGLAHGVVDGDEIQEAAVVGQGADAGVLPELRGHLVLGRVALPEEGERPRCTGIGRGAVADEEHRGHQLPGRIVVDRQQSGLGRVARRAMAIDGDAAGRAHVGMDRHRRRHAGDARQAQRRGRCERAQPGISATARSGRRHGRRHGLLGCPL